MRKAEPAFEQIKDIHVQVFRGQLPDGAHGFVIDGNQGPFLIMLNSADPEDEQRCAFLHEMLHIYNDDFNRIAADGIQAVEARTHSQIEQMFPEDRRSAPEHRILRE